MSNWTCLNHEDSESQGLAIGLHEDGTLSLSAEVARCLAIQILALLGYTVVKTPKKTLVPPFHFEVYDDVDIVDLISLYPFYVALLGENNGTVARLDTARDIAACATKHCSLVVEIVDSEDQTVDMYLAGARILWVPEDEDG